MTDVLGQAIYDNFTGKAAKLWIHNKYGPKEEMPVNAYFRESSKMPEMELVALQQCKGKVLDVGAGAGSHTLVLQEKDVEVTALDSSQKACETMQLRGVKKVIHHDIFTFENDRYDTLLLLMNGIGLTGTLDKLRKFLQHVKKLLHPSGQLIFDSSDVAYLYDNAVLPKEDYYGEIWYRYEYKKQLSGWFKWLYVDKTTLAKIAADEGWQTEVLFEDEFDQYLVRMVCK